ncbi:calcium-binding protein [uncultured Lentibacter sp.]|uniref:calcium-binding protein n=1 Tax=uncultured Lentibacter sp. TaxID=1659309 RepID=UPI002607755A|nr:calcium-binding protein [uncultured Lentibacter sp.]
MLFLAGVMGMALVGATVFIGFDAGEEGDDPALPDIAQDRSVEHLITSGSSGNEALYGSEGADQMNGYGGEDTLDGGAGRDDLHGWTGDDILMGGAGQDTLHGEDGQDSLMGGDDADALYGHNGDDALYGGAGEDMLQGSAGEDALFGGDGADALHGGLGQDTLIGEAGQDTLFGGWGDDVLEGREEGLPEQDFLNGGGGDDRIFAGGFDIVTSGLGRDDIVIGDWIAPGEEAQIEDFDPSQDRLIIVFDSQTTGEAEPDITIARDGFDPDISHILMNGEMIAAVQSDLALSLNDVLIMAQSDAALFFGTGEASSVI